MIGYYAVHDLKEKKYETYIMLRIYFEFWYKKKRKC